MATQREKDEARKVINILDRLAESRDAFKLSTDAFKIEEAVELVKDELLYPVIDSALTE